MLIVKQSGLRPETLLKKRLWCEFCEISKNIFSTEHLLTTASKQLINSHDVREKEIPRIVI